MCGAAAKPAVATGLSWQIPPSATNRATRVPLRCRVDRGDGGDLPGRRPRRART